VEHFSVTFGDPIASSVFEISCGKVDTQTNRGKNRTSAVLAWVASYRLLTARVKVKLQKFGQKSVL